MNKVLTQRVFRHQLKKDKRAFLQNSFERQQLMNDFQKHCRGCFSVLWSFISRWKRRSLSWTWIALCACSCRSPCFVPKSQNHETLLFAYLTPQGGGTVSRKLSHWRRLFSWRRRFMLLMVIRWNSDMERGVPAIAVWLPCRSGVGIKGGGGGLGAVIGGLAREWSTPDEDILDIRPKDVWTQHALQLGTGNNKQNWAKQFQSTWKPRSAIDRCQSRLRVGGASAISLVKSCRQLRGVLQRQTLAPCSTAVRLRQLHNDKQLSWSFSLVTRYRKHCDVHATTRHRNNCHDRNRNFLLHSKDKDKEREREREKGRKKKKREHVLASSNDGSR